MKFSRCMFLGLLCSIVSVSAAPRKSEVIEIINKVNYHWQESHPNPGRAFWDNAAYHTGNMEA